MHALAAEHSWSSSSAASPSSPPPSMRMAGRTVVLRPARFGSASASRRLSAMSFSLMRHAWYKGERPSSSKTLTRPPREMTDFSASILPPSTAWNKGVRPAQSTELTIAPHSSSLLAASAFPQDKACIRAVQPASSASEVLALYLRSTDTPSVWPRFAASINGVVECSVCASGEALRLSNHSMSDPSPRSAAKCRAPTPLPSWAPILACAFDSRSKTLLPLPAKTAERNGVKPAASRLSGSAWAWISWCTSVRSPFRHASCRAVSFRAFGMST
mmetsp:Transcript_66640/g.192510  ORF Transcript_66640/g.192510 Transcript_66640/m.192510 type:complete len:273 (-) Transcript_66640:846-1664(-)